MDVDDANMFFPSGPTNVVSGYDDTVLEIQANDLSGNGGRTGHATSSIDAPKKKARRGRDAANRKRRCVSTACIACRRRKSKCDGAVPSCAACASVYGTECLYDPNSDHRRKGVYRERVDSMKAQTSTLQILIEAILNAAEDDVPGIVSKIRTCDSLDSVAEQILKQSVESNAAEEGSEQEDAQEEDVNEAAGVSEYGERDLARKMGELRVENGSVRFIGGTSHLIYLGGPYDSPNHDPLPVQYTPDDDPIITWTRVTSDPQLINHLMNMYFTYHYAYFTTLSRKLFWRDFTRGRAGIGRGTVYCSSLLVNAMLALGCHFTDIPDAHGTPGDSRTRGDHFFAEAKRLIIENDEYERPRLVTVQALALMSVREAGCAREAKGWVYSGMSFRMAQDIGLNLELNGLDKEQLSDEEVDARRITFWGCFLFDKCWSNYLGRLPQLPANSFNVSKIDVFPDEDASPWTHLTDDGLDQSSEQPARTRAVAFQLFQLCEISSDLLVFFYHPNHIGRSSGKAVELKKLSELHQRLEEWRKALPLEFEATKEGQLPQVILMHMFFHLQYIHLFRPFLKYTPSASPLPAHVSPRRICTANAGAISKLVRLYKRCWNLRQICNIAVYMIHSACTIHLLNLPEKTARRDIIHGIKQLEEIAEDWLCARRTLSILSVLARKWHCGLPEEAALALRRTDEKYGHYSTSEVPSPLSTNPESPGTSEARAYAGIDAGGNRLSAYAQTNIQRPSQPTSMRDRTPGGPPPQTMNNANIPQEQPTTRQDSPGVAFPTDSAAAWASPPATALATPSYNPLISPTPVDSSALDGNESTDLGHVSSVTRNSIDDPEWFLTDSARWHQSFTGWDTSRAAAVQQAHQVQPGDGSMFTFGDQNQSHHHYHNQQSRGSITSMPSPAGSDHLAGFEGLGMSLNEEGWLPGLD